MDAFMDEVSKDRFAHHVQRALSALYDPVALSSSALVRLFALESQRDTAVALRHVLTDSIEGLKPAELTPPGARGWRVYQVLRRRYIEQLTQHEVAQNLSLSIRQLQRQEKIARELLAERLWLERDVEPRVHLLTPILQGDAFDTESSVADELGPSSALQELESLSSTTALQVVALDDVIQDVLATLRPLIANSHVTVEYEPDLQAPPVSVKLTMLRQALLNVASVAVRQALHRRLTIQTRHRDGRAHITMMTARAATDSQSGDSRPSGDEETLQMARRLLVYSQGTLDNATAPTATWGIHISLQAARVYRVLVVDDNADTRLLLERYLQGTRYQFLGVDGAQAALTLLDLAVLAAGLPAAIILDVMMPQMDGWTLLERIREHPRLHAIPVIVSTILPQRELALTFGAADFIHKPIRRDELLAILDRHLAQATESAT